MIHCHEAGDVCVEADGVTVHAGDVRILSDVSLSIVAGEVLALVGPNGAGKSTLLGVLAGDRKPDHGVVLYDGRPVRDWSHLELSRRRAVLTQENTVSFPFRAIEVVEMGRSPWGRGGDFDRDRTAIAAAVAATDVTHLLDRRYTALSGGEKARVSLARVLAQQTDVVLLDEPTAALDLRHQEEVMRTARVLASEGRAVVVVLHDLSLAGAYADRVALLAEGRMVTVGSPDEVLTAETVGDAYGLEVQVIRQPGSGRPLVLPVRT
ncbi:heme ABC transporter ATP-binding protein [Salinibacterium sp. dk2585]|uniref:heme ABC transporter ATP-binding protein n=1 Tax=unclassified Salinibacterium TaxID=2632331 RepID=UPI0011C25239|nr:MULTISPECIES: heme ABC transporter ATP-binding protein [unclassified Salinibacterium]QEE62414.1 heme ABC transporter ATP-binding protein [Salinibacterium sp. dk2585]TXK52703.1 heme ABC transporter ATP-binding protein [Salinibacterium sp. dk5596]